MGPGLGRPGEVCAPSHSQRRGQRRPTATSRRQAARLPFLGLRVGGEAERFASPSGRLVSPMLADVGSDVITAPCYGVNVYVPPHSYVEVLTPM